MNYLCIVFWLWQDREHVMINFVKLGVICAFAERDQEKLNGSLLDVRTSVFSFLEENAILT